MKNIQNFLLAAACLATLSATGCTLLHSDYVRPQVQIPEVWQGAISGGQAAIAQRWWEQYNDPKLNGLIEHALNVNNDLAVAAVRVRKAQLQAGLADTNLTPTVSVGADGSVSRNVKDGGRSSKNYGSSLSLGYEIDLWGKLARERDAAHFEAQATEFDRQSAALSLIGTVADLYWQIAALNERVAMSEANLANGERTLKLTQVKQQAGAVSQLNVVQAEQSLASLRASHASLLQQREQKRHALAIIFDQPPTVLSAESLTLPRADPPLIPEGVPADILAQRPDLAAAELRLRSTLAQQDATRAGFYPSFSLSGSLGTGGNTLSDFLANPIASLGARLALPFIQWNTTKLQLRVSEAEYEEAVINFRKTLYTALLDVEDALSVRRYAETQHALQQEVLAKARRVEEIAELRYRAGETGVQDWLDAQDRRRSAEEAVLNNQLERLNAQMTLFRALGGSGIRLQKTDDGLQKTEGYGL